MSVFVRSIHRPAQASVGDVPSKRPRIATNAISTPLASRQFPSSYPLRWSTTAEALEIAALAAAFTGHVLTLTQALPVVGDTRLAAQTAVACSGSKGANGNPSVHVAWLTAPLLVAAIARSVSLRLLPQRQSSQPTTKAVERLFAEKTLATQAEALAVLSRQVDKLQTRTRIVSRDVREQLKAVQIAGATHGISLSELSGRVDRVEGGLTSLEDLVGGVHGLVEKQFQLLSRVAERQMSSISTTRGPSTSTCGSEECTQRQRPGEIEASLKVEEDKNASMSSGRHSNRIDESGVDEWGRRSFKLGTAYPSKRLNSPGGEGEGLTVAFRPSNAPLPEDELQLRL